MTRTNIIVTLQVEGFHYWENAPQIVKFLRDNHRHIFHFEIEKPVTHDDRDIEIIMFKRDIESYLIEQYGIQTWKPSTVEKRKHPVSGDPQIIPTINWMEFGPMSCEMIAREILEKFDCERVKVTEDNENGAVVYKS